MKTKITLALLLLFSFGGLSAQSRSLSSAAQMSLLTASPGDELYSVFGHSALRVYDPLIAIDEIYNYGTFDFNTPNFYFKFLRGQLLYQLSVSTFEQFLWEYENEQRAVYEQVFNLTFEEKQAIYDFLQINRLPENMEYLYDFFYDNCATRIRDIADNLLNIDWGEDPNPAMERSFRDMLQPSLSNKPWAAFGIDLALGLPADKIASPWDYMFLPDEMFVAFAQARHADGRQLVDSTHVVLPERPFQASSGTPFTPLPVMWALCIAGCLSIFNRRISIAFDRTYFLILGLIGVVTLLLWLFSDHLSTNQNMNLLWAVPTHLYFAFKLKATRASGIVRKYFLGIALLSALLIAFWWAIPQGYHAAFFPLVLLAGVKAVAICDPSGIMKREKYVIPPGS